MDKEKISNKLDELSDYYEELMEDLPKKNIFVKERLVRRGIEKTIELIADTIIDTANILISELNIEKPQDSKSAMDVISKHKIIGMALADKLKSFISFRNLIVHRYAKINNDEEFDHIEENHEDIQKFIEEVDNFVKKSK